MFLKLKKNIWQKLVFKLILTMGLTLLLCISAWSYTSIKYKKQETMSNLSAEADRLSNTIKLGTHYAMMLNSRNDIAEIIKNISRQRDIKAIRIYNKTGQITYSNSPEEIGKVTNIKAEACYVCHNTDPPQVQLNLAERTRIFQAPDGTRMLGILSSINNEPGCASASCHVHPPDKKVLGALDMVMTLAPAEFEIEQYQQRTIGLSLLTLLLTTVAVIIFILRYVNQPVARMIDGTRRIAQGQQAVEIDVGRDDEMGHLARAITHMGLEIELKQAALNKQRDEYQNLFETVPCLITVQDRDYRLVNYNRMFAEKFDPRIGDFCYRAYKGRDQKCESCPVEKTFADGCSHRSEETGFNRDGSITHWLVITSPVKDEFGHTHSAMEISLDITARKLLEQELEKSEQKYHAIFNSIPNAVFVLNEETMRILDCNNSVAAVYGYKKEEMVGKSFLELHEPEERDHYAWLLRTKSVLNQAKQRHMSGSRLYVSIRMSPSEYDGQKVLLVTASDITKRLEAEEQLAQAGKMAVLGEMATGVAHELNQPLSVIKTVSSFFIKKINAGQQLETETLNAMLQKVDSNVDRATKIITHMRLFARKSEVRAAQVMVNDVLERAFDIFNQQLKARGIEVERKFAPNLPAIMADPDRLEQVFINLLLNARDAIDERWEGKEAESGDKTITISTQEAEGKIIVEIQDTGPGVAEAYRDKIFDPFFTTKEVGKGTGLGLSISYGIVKDCGGDIWVKPGNGPGACFVISFPLRKEEDDSEKHFTG